MTMSSSTDRRSQRYEPIFDVDAVTGVSIEVFWADATLETFGRRSVGWFWHFRRRGFAPGAGARSVSYELLSVSGCAVAALPSDCRNERIANLMMRPCAMRVTWKS